MLLFIKGSADKIQKNFLHLRLISRPALESIGLLDVLTVRFQRPQEAPPPPLPSAPCRPAEEIYVRGVDPSAECSSSSESVRD